MEREESPSNDGDLQQFCKDVPKVELHAHLNGSIRDSTINELCVKKNIPRIVNSESNRDLKSCFDLFQVITKLTTDTDTIFRITKEMIEDFANDGVRYLEIRTGPKSNGLGMTKRSYTEAVVAAIDECKDKFQCFPHVLLSVKREESLESAMETVSLAREFPNHIAGIDFSGNPTQGSFGALLPALEYGRRLGYKTTVHFAEVENILESNQMLDFKPDRLGHATFMNEQLRNRVIENKIPVEICLTSNVTSTLVATYDRHHFKDLHSHSHPLSICTDDAGVFVTSLSREFYIAASTFNLSKKDIFQLASDSSKHIFATQRAAELETIFKDFGRREKLA